MSSPAQTATSSPSRARWSAPGSRFARLRSVDSSIFEFVFLLVLIVLATLFYTHYALRVASFQPDEYYYMQLARFISEKFPSGLWQEGIYFRGIQRIDELILAAPFAFLRGASVYQVAHVIQAFLYASTALPVWLLARAAGLNRWARALATTLALVTPWAIVSTSFLAESAAYPAYAWVLYTTWRAARTPSPVRELVALVALVVAAFSRTALIGLVPILPLAVLWQELGWELRGEPWRKRATRLPRQLWSRHRVLTTITLLALLALAISAAGLLPGGGVAALAGKYGLPQLETFHAIFDRYGEYLSRMAVGTGFLAFSLGLAWTLREFVRPGDGSRYALAVVAVLGVAMVLLSLIQGGPDERYVLYAAIPIGLTFAAELDDCVHDARAGSVRASLGSAASVMVGVAAVIFLLVSATWPLVQNEYGYFAYPSATFYRRLLLERLALSHVPLIHLTLAQLVKPGIVLVALAWILTRQSRRMSRPAAILLALGVLAVCATELVYSLDKFTKGAAGNADGTDAAQRSWLETELPPGTDVAAVAIGLGESIADYGPIWETTEFWNTAVETSAGFSYVGIPTVPIGGRPLLLAVHSPSGRIGATVPGAPTDEHFSVPQYMVLPSQATNPDGFAGKLVATDPYLPLDLVRTSLPTRLEWSLAGTSEEGFMRPGHPAVATVYSNALAGGARCASFALTAPPAFSGRWPYTVTSGGDVEAKGSLAEQQTRKIEVRLHPLNVRGGKLAKVSIHVRGKVPYPNGETVSALVSVFSVSRCGASGH